MEYLRSQGRGLEPESWARYLELHSKEMDKDPADSCGAALSRGGRGGGVGKKRRRRRSAGEDCRGGKKIPPFKIQH